MVQVTFFDIEGCNEGHFTIQSIIEAIEPEEMTLPKIFLRILVSRFHQAFVETILLNTNEGRLKKDLVATATV